jgi:thiol-disulfide isomerase/thioredoxin
MRTGVAVAVLAVVLGGCALERTTTDATAPPTTVPGTGAEAPTSVTTAPAPVGAPPTTRVPPDGDPAPDFTLVLGEGGEFTLSDAGTPVHLVFWAEWCPVCSRELPTIDAVAPDYEGRITFVFVAGRSSLEASRARVGTWFSPERILWGYDEELWTTYEVFGQPNSYLISSDGIIVDHWFGHMPEPLLRDRLDALALIG